jgi:Na+/H+ antiporter NhaC
LGSCWLRGMYSMMNAAFLCFFACSQFDVNT